MQLEIPLHVKIATDLCVGKTRDQRMLEWNIFSNLGRKSQKRLPISLSIEQNQCLKPGLKCCIQNLNVKYSHDLLFLHKDIELRWKHALGGAGQRLEEGKEGGSDEACPVVVLCCRSQVGKHHVIDDSYEQPRSLSAKHWRDDKQTGQYVTGCT